LLDLVDQVLLGFAQSPDLEQFLGVSGSFDEGVAGFDLVTVLDLEFGGRRDGVDVLVAVVSDDGDDPSLALVLTDADGSAGGGEGGLALGGASHEELDDPGQTTGDVRSGDTTGVERTHGELGSGFTDGLGGDDADGLTDLDGEVRGEGHAVAGGRD